MGKKSESAASLLVLQSLAKSSRTKKELKRELKEKKPSLKKRTTKKVLRALRTRGEVKKKGKEYYLTKNITITVSEVQTDVSNIPIGMKLRAPKKEKQVKFSDQEDIDEEIERLERELMNNTDDSSSEGEESDDQGINNTNNEVAILSLSEFADDRVARLSLVCLPVPGRYNLKTKNSHKPPAKKSGLEQAVQEVLGGYTARSSEKIPYYCRFCSKKYDNEEAFYEHKTSEFHKTAVTMERKATFCKLCRKQFTSPIQMKEHLASRPHKERLMTVRRGQRKSKR